jgi:hypothetical protein
MTASLTTISELIGLFMRKLRERSHGVPAKVVIGYGFGEASR